MDHEGPYNIVDYVRVYVRPLHVKGHPVTGVSGTYPVDRLRPPPLWGFPRVPRVGLSHLVDLEPSRFVHIQYPVTTPLESFGGGRNLWIYYQPATTL